MKEIVPIHGPDHCPGGPDPIPCFPSNAWARRRIYNQADQSIADGAERNVTMDDFQTEDATIFEAYDVATGTPGRDGISVLRNGLYLINARLVWSDWPDAQMLSINGIDPNSFAAYSFYAGAFTNSLALAGHVHARLSSGHNIYLSVYQESGAARDLEGGAGQGGGSYLEMIYVGPANLDNRGFAA